MAVLQAYQADLLKDLDKGQGLSPDEGPGLSPNNTGALSSALIFPSLNSPATTGYST